MNLLARFHGTRPRRDYHFIPADRNAPAQVHDRSLRLELPAGQFERLRDAHDFAHAIQQFKIAMVEIAVHTHRAENGVRFSGGAVHVKAAGNQAIDNVLDLGVSGALLHDNYHGCLLFPSVLS